MLVVTWNVNSLRARMPRLLELLEQHAPDIVLLQETKCAEPQFPHLELQAAGYTALDHSVGQWTGVAILARDDHDLADAVFGLPDTPLPEEARWVEATVDGLRVASVYVVNGRSLDDPVFPVKLEMLDRIRDRVATLGGSPLLVGGDFNIAPRDVDVWAPEQFVGTTHTSPPERQRLESILAEGLDDAWLAAPDRGEHQYTWWDYRAGAFHRNMGMRIDLALTSPTVTRRLEWVGIDRDFRKGTKPSDHAPLLVRLAEEA